MTETLAAPATDTFRVERSLAIAAPADAIYLLIEDFHRWTAWSPYEDMDASMQRTYSGAELGKGAVYAWAGKGKAGAGTMTITDTAAPNRVTIRLQFTKPFAADNTAEFTLEPQGSETLVTWAMFGPKQTGLMMKLMHMLFDMDKLVGADFEKGLKRLRTAAGA